MRREKEKLSELFEVFDSTKETANYNDPLQIAQKRLACGEISTREYKKIAAFLII